MSLQMAEVIYLVLCCLCMKRWGTKHQGLKKIIIWKIPAPKSTTILCPPALPFKSTWWVAVTLVGIKGGCLGTNVWWVRSWALHLWTKFWSTGKNLLILMPNSSQQGALKTWPMWLLYHLQTLKKAREISIPTIFQNWLIPPVYAGIKVYYILGNHYLISRLLTHSVQNPKNTFWRMDM